VTIGSDFYWNNVYIDEKTRWKGLSFDQIHGFSLTVQKLTASWDSRMAGLKEGYSVCIIGSGLSDPFGGDFPETVVPSIIIDQSEWEIDSESLNSNNKYVYRLREGSLSQYLEFDFSRGSWRFTVSDIEPSQYLNLSRGGHLTLTFKFTDGVDIKYSIIKIFSDIQSTIRYKAGK
jgi:hypothetical protein